MIVKGSGARRFFFSLACTFLALTISIGFIHDLPWGNRVALAYASSPTLTLSTQGTAGHLVGGARLFLPIRHKDYSLHYVDFATSRTQPGSNGSGSIGSLEGNFGFGYRRLVHGFGMVGGYTYYDRLRSDQGHLWSQLTMGFEALTETHSLRLNAYFPQSGKKQVSLVPDDQILVSGTELLYEEANIVVYEQAMRGLDIEVGRRLLSKPYETWGYIGGYTFTGADVPDVTGVRARLESTLDLSLDRIPGSKLLLSLEAQNDQRSGLQGSVGLELRFPFGIGKTPGGDSGGDASGSDTTANSDPLTRTPPRRARVMTALTEPVREIVDVQGALHPLTRQPIPRIWFVTAAGNGVGSMDDPANIEAVKALSNPHDVIIFRGEDGVIDTGAGGHTLKAGQTAAAPQVPLSLMSPSGRIAQITFSGDIGRLTNSEMDTPIMGLNRDNTVLGLSFEGGNREAIRGDKISGIVQIKGNSFSGHAGHAMLLLSGTQSDGPTQLLIEDNDIRDVSSAGIFIETPINHDVNSILISGNRFSDVQEHGVEMRIRGGSVSAVDILDNTWTDIGMDAMYFRSELGAFVEQLNIYDNTITQIDGHGISALLRLNSLATAHISMNSIVDTVKPAILFDVDENSLLRGTVAHNTVGPARTDGINAKVRQSTLDLVISHNVIAPRVFGGFHDAGIYILAFDDAVVSADISNNTIAQTGTGVLVEVLRNSSVFLAMNENTLNQLWWDAGSLNAMASSKIIAAVERNVLDENLLFAFSLLAIDHSHISATFVENGFTEYDLDIDNLGDVTAVIEVEFL